VGAQYLERHAYLNAPPGVSRPLLALIAGVAIGALALAWVLQHRFDYQPCPWCVLQRLLVSAIALTAMLGVVVPGSLAPIVTSALAAVLSLSGVAVALYQHRVAAQSASCNLTLADRIMSTLGLADLWPAMFEATARCDEADRPWLGLPFSLWGAVLFAVLGVGALWALRQSLRWRARVRAASF
jgi:disulfide bond formation protein DsbB